MRENKFRVYEPLNKCMDYLNFALYEYGNDMRNSHKFVLPLGKQRMRNPYTFMNLDAVNVMQYIGVTDKNKKEVYEFDIYNMITLTTDMVVKQMNFHMVLYLILMNYLMMILLLQTLKIVKL